MKVESSRQGANPCPNHLTALLTESETMDRILSHLKRGVWELTKAKEALKEIKPKVLPSKHFVEISKAVWLSEYLLVEISKLVGKQVILRLKRSLRGE